MLFETLSQPKIFAILALTGFLAGFVFDISNYIVWLCKKNKIVQIITDFLATVACCIIFFVVVLQIDYGNVRLYQIISYLTTFLTQRFTLGKLIAKFFDWCYNHFTRLMQKLLKGFQKKKEDEEQSNQSPNQTV